MTPWAGAAEVRWGKAREAPTEWRWFLAAAAPPFAGAVVVAVGAAGGGSLLLLLLLVLGEGHTGSDVVCRLYLSYTTPPPPLPPLPQSPVQSLRRISTSTYPFNDVLVL